MIPEIGGFSLALAFAFSLLLSIYPLWGAYRQNIVLMSSARPLVYGVFICLLLASGCLFYALATHDFTVSYVANNSNTQLPLYFRLAAFWGAHEGSLLLWVMLLACWMLAVALSSRKLPLVNVARVLAVMGMVNGGFLLFILLTSHPFSRTLPDFPIDGRDLNPLLQDVGLIFHPPLLYMGYVGFSVAFSFVIASLLGGKLDSAWVRWLRPWTLAAWVFLTLGIVLGSFWAYYELGWGGWWFWDPVENASLMPWLVGTALIHSLAVTEQRGCFKAWTVLLAISAFSLCLLGTFLVRSGVLVSVHAFASDPARGLFILAYLVIVIGGSLLLYAWKGRQIGQSRVNHQLLSRESSLLVNNVLLLTATVVVLLGTLLPLVHKQLGLGTISVGEPFFNTMFIWLMAPFSLFVGIGPLVRWRRDTASHLRKPLLWALLGTLLLSILLPYLLQDQFAAMALVGLIMAIWVALLALWELLNRSVAGKSIWQRLLSLSRSHWGMFYGHLGLAVTIFGIAFSQNYSVERDVRMAVGDSIEIRDYRFTFQGVQQLQRDNYQSAAGTIAITYRGKEEATLIAEKRYYPVTRSVMTEAAIDGGITRDLYVALGEELSANVWAVRIYYKPFIRWIWLGGLLMALGGLLCIADPRYRQRRRQTVTMEGNI